MQLVAGPSLRSDQPVPTVPDADGSGADDVRPLSGISDYYYQCKHPDHELALGSLLTQLVQTESETLHVAEELTHRYEEIDLLYTISAVLGRTIALEEAASVIVREVSKVVGARRASILVYDAEHRTLRPVAGWGVVVTDFTPIPIDDEVSVAARVFRECDTVLRNASDDGMWKDPDAMTRPYRGRAFLSVPIVYPGPDGVARPVGVINLTDRMSEDVFGHGHAKLVTAIAHQIGAAIENARLVEIDRERQRVRQELQLEHQRVQLEHQRVQHELQLAHDLQLRLLPSPTLLGSQIDVAAICRPVESVGGDFYQFVRLPGSQVGVMLGDVSTHGLAAALIMALVLSAAGIHAVAAESPEAALDQLLASVNSELAETEMYLSLFYGIVDAEHGILRYANAGHPHAWRMSGDGSAKRLEATAPPLGLGEPGAIEGSSVKWNPDSDLLVLVSDGITETKNLAKEEFGKDRVLDIVRQARNNPAVEIVEAVFQAVNSFADVVTDDRTVVVLKA